MKGRPRTRLETPKRPKSFFPPMRINENGVDKQFNIASGLTSGINTTNNSANNSISNSVSNSVSNSRFNSPRTGRSRSTSRTDSPERIGDRGPKPVDVTTAVVYSAVKALDNRILEDHGDSLSSLLKYQKEKNISSTSLVSPSSSSSSFSSSSTLY